MNTGECTNTLDALPENEMGYRGHELPYEGHFSTWRGREVSRKISTSKEQEMFLPHVFCCAKSDGNSHAKVAIGFTTMVGGVVLLCLPIPGARPVAMALIIKGGVDAAQGLGHKETESDDDSSIIGGSIEIDF